MLRLLVSRPGQPYCKTPVVNLQHWQYHGFLRGLCRALPAGSWPDSPTVTPSNCGATTDFLRGAVQGFASGDLDRDGASIRLFANQGLELMLAQSYAKNMGM